jgi:hypothetical protein
MGWMTFTPGLKRWTCPGRYLWRPQQQAARMRLQQQGPSGRYRPTDNSNRCRWRLCFSLCCNWFKFFQGILETVVVHARAKASSILAGTVIILSEAKAHNNNACMSRCVYGHCQHAYTLCYLPDCWPWFPARMLCISAMYVWMTSPSSLTSMSYDWYGSLLSWVRT